MKVAILWNKQVRKERSTPKNKPKNIIGENNKGTCLLIDVALLGDRKIISKETENNLKYKDLILEIQNKWNVEAKVIPVIKRANESLQNHSDNT